MATREEKIAFIQSKMASQQAPTGAPKSREEKLEFIKNKIAENPQAAEEGGFLDDVVAVGKKIDSVTGAPARAFIGAAQNMVSKGENPFKAFASQFGEDPENAPTGKQIAQRAGVPDTSLSDVAPNLIQKGSMADISASGAAGLGIDLAADPTLALPVGKIAKVVGAGAEVGAKALVKGGEIAADIAMTGARKIPGSKAVGVAANVVKDSATNTADALKTMFAPKQAADFQELSKIALKHGIDPKLLPESVEFGQNSFISRAARNRAEGVVGQKHLENFEAGLDAVRDATEKKIAQIGGGHVPSSIEAGELIRKGFDEGVDNFFNNITTTYDTLHKQQPNAIMLPAPMQKINSKLAGIEKWARGRETRGFTDAQRAQATQVLRAIEAVRANNGSNKQMVETLRNIGEVAFKAQNTLADVPPDIKKFRELYDTVSEGLIENSRQWAGNDFADKLIADNKAISEFLGEQSVVSSIIGNKNMSPERVFSSLIEQGDSRKIDALKKILPQETFQRLKGSFLASQIRRNADETFTFKSLQNNLRNKKNVVGTLLSPEEINDISEIIRLGDRFGSPVLSTSGTGGSNLFSDIGKGIRSGVENDTVIGILKDSARSKASKAADVAKEATKVVDETKLLSSKAKPINANYKKLAAISPALARSLAIQGNNKEDPESFTPRGETMWAINGFTKISNSDPTFKNSKKAEFLFNSKKGKELLIRASDLSPNSKAMNSVIAQIKKLGGE